MLAPVVLCCPAISFVIASPAPPESLYTGRCEVTACTIGAPGKLTHWFRILIVDSHTGKIPAAAGLKITGLNMYCVNWGSCWPTLENVCADTKPEVGIR